VAWTGRARRGEDNRVIDLVGLGWARLGKVGSGKAGLGTDHRIFGPAGTFPVFVDEVAADRAAELARVA